MVVKCGAIGGDKSQWYGKTIHKGEEGDKKNWYLFPDNMFLKGAALRNEEWEKGNDNTGINGIQAYLEEAYPRVEYWINSRPGTEPQSSVLAELEYDKDYRMTLVSFPESFCRHRNNQFWIDPDTEMSPVPAVDSTFTVR